MVVARQRPETAKGIVFMLLEDERGDRQPDRPQPRLRPPPRAVRAAALLRARGKLERREGTINVLVAEVGPLERGQPAREPAAAGRAAIPAAARRVRASSPARRRGASGSPPASR